jgi:hypothetical protein
VVVAVRRRDGHDVTDARLHVDGRVVSERLDGKSLELDPGAHSLRVTTSTGLSASSDIVLIEGEKDRVFVITLGETRAVEPSPDAAHPTPSTGASTDPSPWAYVAGGVALVAAGTGTYFGVSGVTERSGCNPNCSDTQRHDIYSVKFPIADVSLAVTAVAAGIAVYLFWAAPRKAVPLSAERFVLRF